MGRDERSLVTGVVCSGALRPPGGNRKEILHFKGFGGGVPHNTETSTVNPWVGIARWQEVFVLFRNGNGRDD